MKLRRGTVRRVAAIWLMVQMAWLTALIPRDCCAAHRPAATQEASGHSHGAAEQCPMRSADGMPCPMHRGATSHAAHGHDASTQTDPSSDAATCVLRGSCAGPMAALLVLLASHGVLPDSTAATPDIAVRSIVMAAADSVAGHALPPDPPPPRA